MSGTYRGTIDCLIAETDEFDNAFVAYKHIYDLLAGHPGTTLIARQGFVPDYPDGVNPPVAQDFCVFRFDTHAGRDHPWYIFVKVGGNGSAIANVQLNGAAPQAFNGQIYVSAAVGIGGDENPWQGSTAADGTDTHPAQFWDNPSAGTNVQVVPASNRDGGSDGTNKENGLQALNQVTPGNLRYHVVCDDDSIHFAWDVSDDGTYELSSFGVLDENPGLAWDATALYCFYNSVGAPADNPGSVGSEDLSGLVHPDGAQTTFSSLPINIWGIRNTEITDHPSKLGSGHDTFPHHVNSTGLGHEGYVGQIPNLRAIYNFPTNDTDTLQEFVSLGGATVPFTHTFFPWDGATSPQSTVVRDGVSFTRAP